MKLKPYDPKEEKSKSTAIAKAVWRDVLDAQESNRPLTEIATKDILKTLSSDSRIDYFDSQKQLLGVADFEREAGTNSLLLSYTPNSDDGDLGLYGLVYFRTFLNYMFREDYDKLGLEKLFVFDEKTRDEIRGEDLSAIDLEDQDPDDESLSEIENRKY